MFRVAPIFQNFSEEGLRRAQGFAVFIHKAVDGVAGGKLFARASHFVVEAEARPGSIAHIEMDFDAIVEKGRFFIIDGGAEHGDEKALGLDAGVGEVDLIEHLDTGGFKPDQIVAVVHDFHAVGFGIAHAEFGNSMDHFLSRVGALFAIKAWR